MENRIDKKNIAETRQGRPGEERQQSSQPPIDRADAQRERSVQGQPMSNRMQESEDPRARRENQRSREDEKERDGVL